MISSDSHLKYACNAISWLEKELLVNPHDKYIYFRLEQMHFNQLYYFTKTNETDCNRYSLRTNNYKF